MEIYRGHIVYSKKDELVELSNGYIAVANGVIQGVYKELAKEYNAPTQTHIVESLWEKEEAKKCFDDCRCDMQIYDEAGLLNVKPFIAAHFIFPSEEDIKLVTYSHHLKKWRLLAR